METTKLTGLPGGASSIGQPLSKGVHRGRFAALLAALLALSLVPACGDDTRETPLEPTSTEQAADSQPAGLPTHSPGPDRGPTAAEAPRDATRDALAKLRDPDRFRGTGAIRGRIGMPRGGAPSAPSTVTVVPSKVLAGREHAVERQVVVPAGEAEFALEGLPLGGYDLRARTKGFASRALAVQLERGSNEPYLQVALEPLGTIHGELIDEAGDPVEGRAVHVRLRRTGEVRSTESRADGTWVFDDADQGAWTLVVGPLDAPKIEQDFDNVGARSSNLGRQVLPVTTTIEVWVQDELQSPVPGAQVLGYNDRGDTFEIRTDERGVATAEFASFGEWKVTAVADDGRRARKTVRVESKDPPRIYIDLPR